MKLQSGTSLNLLQPFNRADARAAGMTLQELLSPRFQRILYDVYVSAAVQISLPLLATAALAISAPGAYASHVTAAALWGAIVPHWRYQVVCVNASEEARQRMDSMAKTDGPKRPAQEAVDRLLDRGFLDELMDRVDEGGVQLTGEGGFLPELVKRVLEAGLQAELTGHLGYEKHDPAGNGSGNSRNGATDKRLGTEIGDSTWPRRGTVTEPSTRSWWRRANAGSAA